MPHVYNPIAPERIAPVPAAHCTLSTTAVPVPVPVPVVVPVVVVGGVTQAVLLLLETCPEGHGVQFAAPGLADIVLP